jgi:CDP-diacylglycerol--serine O-phosphatidyltransferase
MRQRHWTKERRREQYRKGMFLLPSLFTVLNIFAGFYSVSSSILIARLTHTTSDFGLQFDSLADVITFGMAPAVLSYQWAFSNFEVYSIDRLGWLVSFVFLICAASRLARFNVQKSAGHPDKRYFVGMPTPAAAGMVAATVYFFPEPLEDDLHAVAALFMVALLSFLMVSRVRYRSFKDLNLREPRSYRITVVPALVLVALVLNLRLSLISLSTIYVLSGLVGTVLTRRRTPAPESSADAASSSP